MPKEGFGKRGVDARTPEQKGEARQARIMQLAGEINRLTDEKTALMQASASDRIHQDRRRLDEIDGLLAVKEAELKTLKEGPFGAPGR